MFKATSKVKTSGSFHGKSNTLGHGGRAAQLKARGVPGGVIGNLARAAHAAPGQANYHGKKGSIKKKAATLEGGPATAGSRVNPATVKNPAWVSAGAKSAGTPGYTPKVNISPSTGWMSGGKPLKGAKRKKASKPQMEMAYKKPKKKASK